ncbi:MAG: ion transporter [Pseudorhodobacter sp.]
MADIGQGGFRARLRHFIELPIVRNIILVLVIANAIILGLSTSTYIQTQIPRLIFLADRVILAIFVLEIGAKLIAYGLGFWRNAWNVFDFCVVGVGLMPQTNSLSALRALRVIRALRVLSVVPQMRAVVKALFDALPGMGAVIIMLSVVFYVFAVMATIMFGRQFDEWFGTIGASLYSLFQIMTLESWSMGIVRPVMYEFPYAWAFFVPFIVVTSFSVLNLFIGLLVNTMQAAVEAEAEAEFERLRDLVHSETEQVGNEVIALRGEVKELKEEIRALLEAKNG